VRIFGSVARHEADSASDLTSWWRWSRKGAFSIWVGCSWIFRSFSAAASMS
jgi:hypothetical protein